MPTQPAADVTDDIACAWRGRNKTNVRLPNNEINFMVRRMEIIDKRPLTTSRPEDFCLDVLAILKRRKVTFRGLHPYEIRIYLDGAVDAEFEGIDKGGTVCRKKINFMSYAEIKDAIHLGKPEVISDIVEQLIDQNSARFY